MKEFLEQPKSGDTKRTKEFLEKMKDGSDWHDFETVTGFRERFINTVFDFLSEKISKDYSIDLSTLEKYDLKETIKEVLLEPIGEDEFGLKDTLIGNVGKDIFNLDLNEKEARVNLNKNIVLFTIGSGSREIEDRFFENTWGIDLEQLLGPYAQLKQDTGNREKNKKFYEALQITIKKLILQAREEQNIEKK